MRSKRYLKDYQLTPTVTAKGRLSPVASYVGAYHRFTAEPEKMRRAKRSYLVLAAAAVLLLAVLLWFSDVMDRERRYLLIPMAFNVFPAFGVVMDAESLATLDAIASQPVDGSYRPLAHQTIATIRVETFDEEYPDPETFKREKKKK